MASANSYIQIAELDFDTIKTIIISEITNNNPYIINNETFTESIKNISTKVINLDSYKKYIKENYNDPKIGRAHVWTPVT